jgi:hypothetical protein
VVVRAVIQLAAESRGELVDKFAGEYRELREQVEQLITAGMLPPMEIKWVLVGGRWEEPK